ncbi:MAG: FAD-binding oxidoreductase [Deltaproteobacteria bacterium]|nr:MAG: FAD-binding oxidoreductase [Deltaproteobacteria bacterium]
MSNKTYDVVIIGGGIMGCATAYYLMQTDQRLKVAIVEMDPTYTYASTTLSLANVRVQFSLQENIQISQYAYQAFGQFEDQMTTDGNKPSISYRREGNLFLVDETGRVAAAEALALQKRLGCQVEWWSGAQIKEHYPLFKTDDLAGGTFGQMDGYLDAYAVLMGYKTKAKYLGAEYINDEVIEVTTSGGRVSGVRLGAGEGLTSKYIVNCAGAWAAKLAQTAGIELPVQPVKRQVFVLNTAVKPKGPLPLTILPSGLYFRTETGDLLLVGKSMVEDPVGFDFTWDDKRFTEILWPELAKIVPAFDTLKLRRGWAGLYAVNTLDGNAILGEWPELGGFYLANGFSGHGLQQAPAVGRYLSELITGKPPILDLSIFSPKRILENKPLSEGGLV